MKITNRWVEGRCFVASNEQGNSVVMEGAADEGDTRSEALMAMVQTELFDALVQIGELPDEELPPMERFDLISEGAKRIAGLISASTRLKEYQGKVKARAQPTADEVAQAIKKGGLSHDTAEQIRKQILGIAT